MFKRMPRGARAVVAGAVTAAVLTGGAVAALAQGGAPPALRLVFLSTGKLTFSGQSAITGKAATLAISSNDPRKKAQHAAGLVRLEPGVTLAEATAAVARAEDFDDLEGVGILDSFVGAPPRGAKPLTSATKIVAGATYIVLDLSSEQAAAAGSFTAGGAKRAKLPAATASATMKDYRFTTPSSLPRTGSIRIANRGKQYHEMLGYHVARGADPNAVVARLKQGKNPKKGTTDGEALLQAPVGPGAVNQVPFKVAPGAYVLTCSLPDPQGRSHATRGMNKVVRVQ
jgi:hypothetical protein